MKLTIGYTAYHEIEMEAPPDIEEAYHKYQKMWADYEADPLNAPYPCDYAEEDKIRRWAEKLLADRMVTTTLRISATPKPTKLSFVIKER